MIKARIKATIVPRRGYHTHHTGTRIKIRVRWHHTASGCDQLHLPCASREQRTEVALQALKHSPHSKIISRQTRAQLQHAALTASLISIPHSQRLRSPDMENAHKPQRAHRGSGCIHHRQGQKTRHAIQGKGKQGLRCSQAGCA